MHSAARGARNVFGIIVAFALLGSVLAVPTVARAASDSEPAVVAAKDAELVRLTDRAKDEFRARISPWAPYSVVEVVSREPTQAVRAYVLRSFESAIDALVAEAHRSPQAARAVEAALQRLVASGSTFRTDAIFSEIIEREMAAGQVGARPAAAIRNSVALRELPGALASLIDLPEPFGEKALPAYRRAAEVDPDEPWTWIAIAWMGEATALAGPYKLWPQTAMTWMGETADAEVAEVESALDKGEAAALAGREDDAVIAALLVRARVRLTQMRANEAERALLEAVRMAEEQARVEPGLQANLALCLNLLGDFYARQEDHERAATAYHGALEIRQRLATAAPDDEAKQLDLAASHVRLAKLAGKTGGGTEANEHIDEANRIEHAVNSRHRFTPIVLHAAGSSRIMLEQAFLLAGILTLVGGFVLLARYRRMVDRWMKAGASATGTMATSAGETATAPAAGGRELAIRSLAATAGKGSAAFVYVVAGCAFAAVVAPALAFWLSGFWNSAGPAVLVLALLWGILTLVGGFVLAQYRRMKAAARASRPPPASAAETPPAAAAGGRELAIRSLTAIAGEGSFALRSASMNAAGRALRRAAFVYAVAGCAFAVVAAVQRFSFTDLDFNPVRAAMMFWGWAWPTVLVLSLLWGRDRMKVTLVIGAYLGGLLLICAVVAARGNPALDLFGVSVPAFFGPLIVWAYTIRDTPFLLFFLNRRVRSVGPVLLVFILIVSIGWLLGRLVTSTDTVLEALASLSRTLSLPRSTFDYLVEFLGMVVLVLPAWWVLGRIRRAYQAKWLSDQMLVFDTIWLFQALILCRELSFEVGLSGVVGLAAFVAYKIVTIVGLRPLAVGASRRAIAKLLLLRVFGFRGRTERLFDVLEARWRYAGPIQMIAAPDLAARTIDPGEFMDFLSGRLRRQFLIEPGDLQRRMAEIDLRPDADGRFRVNDLFCGNETWQAAVERLMSQSDLVAMDLRGFAPQNKGCVFELQALLDTVPITRFVLLVDATTDQPFLRRTLAESVGRMAPTSPNREIRHPLTMLEVGKSDVAAVAMLMRIADDVLAPAETPLVPAAAAQGVAPAQ